MFIPDSRVDLFDELTLLLLSLAGLVFETKRSENSLANLSHILTGFTLPYVKLLMLFLKKLKITKKM